MKQIEKKQLQQWLLLAVCLLCVIVVWIYKYRENYNYLNSNASWHVLLTVQAYDETPASIHKFLPIVSLGDELDKEIQWAEMVADEQGNYYYTSFSPAGYVLPYLFFKLFGLDVAEKSLYIFNTMLCCLALLFTIKLFIDIFGEHLQKWLIIVLTTMLFAFQTEIMHGMGQVYWHQSFMQVLLPLQFLCFYHFHEEKKLWKIGFFILAIIMPYVEWTGFVANVGFALVLFFRHGIRIQKNDFLWAFLTGICTLTALLLLCGHYLLVIDWNEFVCALRDRVMMRTKYASAPLFNLLWGYWKSFKGLWIVLGILGCGCVIVHKGVKWLRNVDYMFPMLFVMAFPIIENIAMKEHATSYTYDRMKLVFPLIFIFFILLCHVLNGRKERSYVAVVLVAVISVFTIKSYTENTEYLWEAPYKETNEILATYCKGHYHENCVYGLENAAVRGYANLLFDRGMYENIEKSELMELARERSARYAVLVHAASEPDPANAWNMYAFDRVSVYDMETGEESLIMVEDGSVVEEIFNEGMY